MKIAYLINTYPVTSSTFIRREISALERRGLSIERYAVRSWSDSLVDQQDRDEWERTHYLLTGNVAGLILAFVRAMLTDPVSVARGARVSGRLVRNARGRVIQHIAYLLQAVYLRQHTAKNGISHVHVHYSTNSTAVAMLSEAMGGPSYSFTAHGPDEFDAPELNSLGLKVERAAFVVAISDYCKTV
ncbi:MAG: colanic acid biosynthesis glycosyltransferase WcaL, partial [Acidimicrobiales bacterium]